LILKEERRKPYLARVAGVGEVIGVASAGVLVRCGSDRPASLICTRAAIHRRVVEHMDGVRTVSSRVVVVGDAVAHALLLLLSLLLLLLLLLLHLVVYRRRCRCRCNQWWQWQRACLLHHRGPAALSEEPRDRVPHSA